MYKNELSYQNKYWQLLWNLKAQNLYLRAYHQREEFINRCLTIAIALTSSSSVLGWIIWNSYPLLWTTIIAISQLISVISNYLPYKKRIDFTSKLSYSLEDLFLSMERNWLHVSKGYLTNNEINNLLSDIKEKIALLEKAYLGDNTLPRKNKLNSKVTNAVVLYFDQYFFGDNHERKNVL
jgi:hypothetical protein